MTIGSNVHELSTDTTHDCDACVLTRHTFFGTLAHVTALVHELVALVAPPACPGCRAALPGAALRLCPACASSLPWLGPATCPACALPAHGGGRCPAAQAAFARAWAPLAYDGVARELVGALKFRGALPLAGLMAAQVAANLPRDVRARVQTGRLAVVPVPAQPRRRRRRGFDPAGALAVEVARRLGVALSPCLARRDHAPRQVGTGRRARRAPGRLALALREAPPPLALLVDDVHTTGATLDACARALREGGCEEVVGVSYARTL
jgi:predicted amidophosphoribosyltransferase